MSKFKVGNKIVGNAGANRYCITKEGWEGVVEQTLSNGLISAKSLTDSKIFTLHENCFDLLDPRPRSNYV